MPKTTSEEMNKRKQSLAQKKQKPTVNRNTTKNKWAINEPRD
jgi:hypothetical protein